MGDTEGERAKEARDADEKKEVAELTERAHHQQRDYSRKEDDRHKNVTHGLGLHVHATNTHRLLLFLSKSMEVNVGDEREQDIVNRNDRSSLSHSPNPTRTCAC